MLNNRRAHLTDRELYKKFYDADMHPGVIFPMLEAEPRLQWALAHIGPDDDVIDIGCHKGAMTRYYPTFTEGRVVGLDISPAALRDAALAFQGLPITWLVGDAAAIKLPDDAFDVAVLAEILEHVPDVDAVVREAERLVRPGGRIVVSVPINAFAIDELDRVERIERIGFDLDMHVREFLPAAYFAGRPDLRTEEQWVVLGDGTNGLPEKMGFRMAAYTVAPATAS